MLPNIKNTIESAINNKRLLLLRYKKQSRSRLVEPHLLYTSQNNRLVMVGYQVKGYTSRGRTSPFWRPYRISKIQNLYVIDEIFRPRTDRGYETVRKMVKGQVESQINLQESQYTYFNNRILGPPIPDYLQNQSGLFAITGRTGDQRSTH